MASRKPTAPPPGALVRTSGGSFTDNAEHNQQLTKRLTAVEDDVFDLQIKRIADVEKDVAVLKWAVGTLGALVLLLLGVLLKR